MDRFSASASHGHTVIRAAETFLKMFGLQGVQVGVENDTMGVHAASTPMRTSEVSPLIRSRLEDLEKHRQSREVE